MLSSLLSGGAYGTELGNMVDGPTAGQDGHLFVVFNVAAFTDATAFRRRVDAAIRQIHESRRAPGVARLYAPGEVELLTEQRYREDGIPLTEETLRDVAQTAHALGLPDVFALRE
jgi:LDH2 family malate/lactate/ureidoglycolate dehydrogenase